VEKGGKKPWWQPSGEGDDDDDDDAAQSALLIKAGDLLCYVGEKRSGAKKEKKRKNDPTKPLAPTTNQPTNQPTRMDPASNANRFHPRYSFKKKIWANTACCFGSGGGKVTGGYVWMVGG
jgi:hypothetical protein